MKPISYEKEIDTGALLKKQMSSREVANAVNLLQSKLNRIRRNHFENIVMPKEGRPQALITWKKRCIARLVTIGGLNTIVEATRELKGAS
jgi:hypothetical protein